VFDAAHLIGGPFPKLGLHLGLSDTYDGIRTFQTNMHRFAQWTRRQAASVAKSTGRIHDDNCQIFGQ
jgi:hypothetical protein